MRRWRIAGFVVGLVLAGPALAEQHFCRTPLADWKPPTALVDLLTSEGWRDIRVRIDDGCYKARAVKDTGERMERKYDPGTLVPLPRGGGHDRGHGAGESD